ncbi:MAG: dimethylarginine dimethylaminohydrolase family protein [Candidatus Longimicrobiales bacterium M2_2A_002]
MLALTRPVSPTLHRCQLTHRERVPIDVARARAEHAAYERALQAAGCRVVRVPAAPGLPDAVFIEDTAVVFDEVAVVARPGAVSRRPEVDAVARTLAGYRPLEAIRPPATLDGGDVLMAGRTVLVGISARTTAAGATQLRSIVEPLGYDVRTVPVRGCLHLKTAATALDDATLLVNPGWVDPADLGGFRAVEVAPGEPDAANVLRVGGRVLMAAGHPATADRVRQLGAEVVEVAVSELMKAESGVTCCSLIVGQRRGVGSGPATH